VQRRSTGELAEVDRPYWDRLMAQQTPTRLIRDDLHAAQLEDDVFDALGAPQYELH
jgi:hypothetical protein